MTTTKTAASMAELIDRIAARRLTCDDPATDLLPEHAAGVLDYVLIQRRVPHAVLRADAEDALLLAVLLHKQADEIEYSTIGLARKMGLTWARIAALRGKHSPQAAEQLYQRLAASIAGEPRQVAEGRQQTRSKGRATTNRPVPGGSGHRKVHIDDDTWEKLAQLADDAGTNRSAVLRDETRERWRRRERRRVREQGKGFRPPPHSGGGPPEVVWAEHNHEEAVRVAEALASIEVPGVAAESAAWVAEVLHDSDAPATWLPMALGLVYKELKGLGLADKELESDEQLNALPGDLASRLAALAREWDDVTRDPLTQAARARATPVRPHTAGTDHAATQKPVRRRAS